MKHSQFQAFGRRQQGVSLIVVMVMLLLGTIVVLSSTRVGWLNERLVGGESDYQRAFAAAEALIRDAERDIRGLQINNVTPCSNNAGYVGCRNFAGNQPFFPQEDNDLDLLQARVASGANTCLQGICLPASVTALGAATWTTNLTAMTAGTGATSIGAKYGEFTGIDPAAAGNPLLSWSRPGVVPVVAPRAWYWVEVFRYTDAAGIVAAAGNVPIPDKKHPYVYRITAYVQGMKGGTRVWLRSVFVPRPQNQNI
ncbi:pilus assembly PilX family protein [Hydrogenophaga sp.]|uniref:pilus assembly PilX family protein n=1 Tax=Hydrogenophaga sp. TaxID=1904254 RepID=UPI003F6E5BCD